MILLIVPPICVDSQSVLDRSTPESFGAFEAAIRTLPFVLDCHLVAGDFGYFLSQRGMFSYTGLSAAQVDRLREEFAVYLIRSGRLCIAGLNTGNVEATAQAMAAVM